MRLIDADALETHEQLEPMGNGRYENVQIVYKNDIDAAPTIKPERKRGQWIDKSGGIEGAWNYCSVCGEQAIDLYDYCPNCGADMRGEQE